MTIINEIRTLFGIHRCSICSSNIALYINEGSREIDNEFYCRSCARIHFKICDCCNEVVGRLKKIGKNYICYSCFKNRTVICSHCGEVAIDSECFISNGYKVCDQCYSSINRSFHDINIGEKKKTSNTFTKNKNKRYCGVEIECISKDRNKDCFIFKELKDFRFSQGRDGSLSYGGVEFRSVPANGDLLFNSIENFCKALIKKHYEVDRSCGLHIHLEVEHNLEFLKKLYLFYLRFETLFFDMLPKSRRSSEFCKRFKRYYNDTPEKIININTLDKFKEMLYETKYYNNDIRQHSNQKRYCWANLHSIFYRGTLEIRSHSGTINSSKIINWITIHQEVLKFLEKNSLNKIGTMEVSRKSFLKIFSKPIQNYIKRRWKTFINFEEKDLNVCFPSYKIKIKK